MAQYIDLAHLSRDELIVLASRIECRIRTLSDAAAEKTTVNSHARSCPATGVAGHRSAHHVTAPEANPGARTTVSEKVQELIQANDPWEGSGVGPTRWSLPFYGGHIIRTPEVFECSPRAQMGPDLLPVFGGSPYADTGGKSSRLPSADVSATSVSSQRHQHSTCLKLCAICYSPCCIGGLPHGLHACERHRLQ